WDEDKGLPQVATRKLAPVERYGLRVTLFAAAIVLVAIPFGLLLQQVASDGPFTTFDLEVAAWLNRQVSPRGWAVDVAQVVSFLGKPIFLIFAVGVPGLWIAWRREWRLVIFLAVTCLGGGLVSTAVKLAVGRGRPVVDNPIATAFGQSFPSGHAMASLVCYGALLLVFLPLAPRHRRHALVGVAVAVVAAIGVTRLALGLHFTTDVVAGYVLGAAWLVASVAAFEIWRQDRGRRRTRPLEEGVEPEEIRDLVQG
ncbi:MAG: phosphatase PAP2 family protein, partial [Actinomycetota bacterium]